MTPPITAMTIIAHPQVNCCGAGSVPGSHGSNVKVATRLSGLASSSRSQVGARDISGAACLTSEAPSVGIRSSEPFGSR
jgi:hypothetical protein